MNKNNSTINFDILRNQGGYWLILNSKEEPESEIEARKVAANLGCEAYIESSSLTQKNLKEVFDNAIVEGMRFRSIREQKSAGKGKGKKHKKCEIL